HRFDSGRRLQLKFGRNKVSNIMEKSFKKKLYTENEVREILSKSSIYVDKTPEEFDVMVQEILEQNRDEIKRSDEM
ncbi:MAG: hypothetical protein KAR13_19930, partial [Desulfobulbaceae bacterium]|nr:hypothetical protein [Desulfobulbaceae bacterium]